MISVNRWPDPYQIIVNDRLQHTRTTRTFGIKSQILTLSVAIFLAIHCFSRYAAAQKESVISDGNPAEDRLVTNWLRMDKDGDEKVTKDEAEGQLKTSFDRNDADKDGFLVRSELEALARRRRGRNVTAEQTQPTTATRRRCPPKSC